MKKGLLILIAGTLSVLCLGKNMLPNSSFELGSAGWGIRTVVPKLDGKYRAIREKISSGQAVHGLSLLELSNPKGHTVQVCSIGIPVKPGKHTFSIWLKGDRDFPAELQIFSSIKGNWICPGKKVAVSREWKRHVLTAKIPDEFSEIVVRVQFQTPGTLCLDAAQLERGDAASIYAPSSSLEAALTMPKTWVTAGTHPVEFRAVLYEGKEQTIPFRVQAENRQTGWKREIHKTLSLSPGKAVQTLLPLSMDNRGFIRLTGSWETGTALPFYTAVLHPLPPGRFSPEQGFCTGVNETGVFRNSGDAHNPYQGLGIDFSEHLAMLHATGVSLIRLFEYELSRPWLLNPERKKFDFAHLNAYLNAVADSELTAYICLDADAFSWNPGAKSVNGFRKADWFMIRDGEKNGKNPLKSITVYPRMDDWRDYIEACVRNCKGRIRYYEIINEPNLRLTDPARYTAYLKEAFQTARKADPDCRIIGICATEDYGASGGSYTAQCAKLGAFQFLDAVSFHPYRTALDNSEIPAETLLDELNELRKKYRPGVPLWNTELFYIHSIQDAQKYRKSNPQFLRPENLARRYLIDLGEGVQVSTPLHVWQLFEKVYVHQDADQTWFGHKAVPNAAAVAQNAFVHFLRGATPAGRAVLPEGIRGYHYRCADRKTEITAIWALNNQAKFHFSVPRGIRVYDLFGNPIDGTKQNLLSEVPVYLEGSGLKQRLGQIQFRPQVELEITGSRFRSPHQLAIEFENRKNSSLALIARLFGESEIHRFTIPANQRCTRIFQTKNTAPELLLSYGESQKRRKLQPIPERKTIRSGETVTVADALTFSLEVRKEELIVSASVKDRQRGKRIPNQPWTGDCLELFLDTQPEKNLSSALLDRNVFRLFLAPRSSNGLPEELSGSPHLDLRTIRWTLRETETGYSCQIAIPWKTIGCDGPSEIGFDIIADDTENSRRIACHAWAGNDENYRNRFQFGRLLLTPNPGN